MNREQHLTNFWMVCVYKYGKGEFQVPKIAPMMVLKKKAIVNCVLMNTNINIIKINYNIYIINYISVYTYIFSATCENYQKCLNVICFLFVE